MTGNGATATSSTAIDTGVYVARATGTSVTANTFSSSGAYITNYSGSTAKVVSTDSIDENNATTANQFIVASTWVGTAAISSIKLSTFSGNNFAEGSTASLYTITKGSGGATVS